MKIIPSIPPYDEVRCYVKVIWRPFTDECTSFCLIRSYFVYSCWLFTNLLFASLSFFQCLYAYYAHSALIPTFHRRCYWLLQVGTSKSVFSSPLYEHCNSFHVLVILQTTEQRRFLNIPRTPCGSPNYIICIARNHYTVGSLPKYPFSRPEMMGKFGVIRILRRSLTNIKGTLSIYGPFFTIAPRLNPKIKVYRMNKILRKTGTSIISGTITHNTNIIAHNVLLAHGMSILHGV